MAMKGSAVEWVPKLSRDVVEVMFTAPAQGARSRMLIRADADVSEVIKQGRKKLGFDQDWMPDSDFKLYNAEDEDAGPLKGKMSENEWPHRLLLRDPPVLRASVEPFFICCLRFSTSRIREDGKRKRPSI